MQYLEKRDNFILIGSQVSILGQPTKYGADLPSSWLVLKGGTTLSARQEKR
jgi:hypothetical protein